MRPLFLVPFVSIVMAAAAVGFSQQPLATPITYRFEEVKSKVLRLPGGDAKREEVRVATGETAEAGDVVRTGFWGHALLSVPERGCRFELFPSARVRLAGSEPGVLVVLESGRLEGFFDRFTGASEERRVAAPGALLVVRGTRYGLEIGTDSQATLAVFEGTVEVVPTAPGAPTVLVGPGEYGVFGPKTAPRKGSMPPGADEKSWRSRGSAALAASSGLQQGQGAQAPGQGGSQGGSQGRGSSSSSRGRN